MVKGFSRAQIALHWVVALMIIYQLWMGDDMSSLLRQIRQNGPTPTTTGAWVHIILGSLILALYQRPVQLTCAQLLVVIEVTVLGSFAKKFHALQQASTISS